MEEDLKIKNLQERIDKIEEAMVNVATGDFSVRLETPIEDEFTTVEAGINLMIEDLSEELRQREKKEKELRDKLTTIEKQKQTILQQQEDLMELSSPVIKIWDDVLVLPVIGTVDSRRAQIMMENLLQSIVDSGCSIAILDITGVLRIDTQVANHLIKTVEAVRLLGGECIISGISPAIAQTIVQLGIDLSAIKTKANLQEGMKYAFLKSNLQVKSAGTDSDKADEV
ncbi:MAG: STAS domain-containing protein [Candidatus Aminicenantes bacterium]|nr:STAS domain-containing protein [Candidatus Aminicenantes bacterium]